MISCSKLVLNSFFPSNFGGKVSDIIRISFHRNLSLVHASYERRTRTDRIQNSSTPKTKLDECLSWGVLSTEAVLSTEVESNSYELDQLSM